MKILAFLCIFSFIKIASASRVDGVWLLVEARDLSSSGEWVYPFGEKPSGVFVYSKSGLTSVQIPGHIGYVGRYTVSETEIIHYVESAWDPSIAGTLQVRPYTVDGDTLILGDQKTWIRILKRQQAVMPEEKGRICTRRVLGKCVKWQIKG